MPRQRSDVPEFARHLPAYVLDPRALCSDSKPAEATDNDEPESTDPAIRLELAATIEGAK